MDYEKAYNEALERAKRLRDSKYQTMNAKRVVEEIFPVLAESEDERVIKRLSSLVGILNSEFFKGDNPSKEQCLAYLEKQKESLHIQKTCKENADSFTSKQKEQKPIIQDVELNDAVYDYVRDHFIAGADFTPEYIKKLMENAFFAGVDYYLLKQESESCDPDTNVEKVIEDVIRVYGKTQGEWVGGYDVDTLIVNLRRAFNEKEQKPLITGNDFGWIDELKHDLKHPEELDEKVDDVLKQRNGTRALEWSEEDESQLDDIEKAISNYYDLNHAPQPRLSKEDFIKFGNLEYERGFKDGERSHWKPSEEQMCYLKKVYESYYFCDGERNALESLYNDLKKLI